MLPTLREPIDILILSNGPGELVTWVKPVLRALRSRFGDDRGQLRISLVLSPCPNASGNEVAIAQSYSEVDRVQGAADFFPFLLWGKTRAGWDWRSRGVVIFLGGDQLFPVIIGKRLGYKTLLYCEWEARWPQWVDHFAVMNPAIMEKAKPQFREKITVVGDLMTEVDPNLGGPTSAIGVESIALLPGSKPAKLMQGVPIMLAVADRLQALRPQTEFFIPVAPTLSLAELAQYAQREGNPGFDLVQGAAAHLVREGAVDYLVTTQQTRVRLYPSEADRVPPYGLLKQCALCLTTVGANTAELGALAVPMVVIVPTNQLDAMRSWDGILGILANLPGVGTVLAKLINRQMLKRVGLLAWPNIWAGEQIVPELVGLLYPDDVTQVMRDYLEHPEKLQAMRSALQAARGEAGAATKLAAIVAGWVQTV
ncbi:MAG: hypothetical protein RLZZ511_224 [Cyanobacteriota bacterium]|jgi:lipid-A-disaccharide synthase